VKRVITLVNKKDYIPIAARVGLDAAVSPRLAAANAILRYMRPKSVTRVAAFKGIQAEAISFEVSSRSPLVGRTLADVEFPEGAIVAARIRGSEVAVPRGVDTLEAGDTAIVFTLPAAADATTALFPSP
jgi:trk system potassium uptake protein TrkA